jgi:riboflavin kinase
LLGAIKNKIEISSQDLAEQINTSQQTASRYLLELDKLKMITRELGIKKQLISITETGHEQLHKQFLSYKQIFELTNKVHFKGSVISGLGEGRYYTEQEGYSKQFKNRLGIVAYPGTLNIEIPYIEKNKLRLLKNQSGIIIDEFTTKDRTFGAVKCFKAKINGVDGALVLPMRSHYSNILEFISKHNLRQKFNLKDGDQIEVVIYFEN